MSNQIRADYTEQYLLPPCVEDWIPADHPARFVREFVDALDFEELGIKENTGTDGRPHFAPDLLMKVWLYGYFSHIYSTRKLEKACTENMALIWLTGNKVPDHNTLWRFFSKNKKALRELFKRGVKIAVEAKLVGMVLHAVDGTKIKAKVSKRTGWHREDLEKLLGKIDEGIDRMEKQVESAEGQEAGEWRLPEELRDKAALRRKIEEALAVLEAEGEEHLHPVDKEARMMKCEGRTGFGYNGQVVVDGDSGLIVAQDVVSDEADAHLLVPMLEETEGVLGVVAEDTAADGGYFSSEQVAEAQQKEYGVLVPMECEKEKGQYHASKFEYDTERDVVKCPRGEELIYKQKKESKRGYQVRVYRCTTYMECPARCECSKDKRGRHIEISQYHEAIRRQAAKQKDEAARQKLKRRGGIVEKVFGFIKEQFGFRRFTFNGLDSVKGQWSLVCTVVNLRKMYRWWVEGRLVLA